MPEQRAIYQYRRMIWTVAAEWDDAREKITGVLTQLQWPYDMRYHPYDTTWCLWDVHPYGRWEWFSIYLYRDAQTVWLSVPDTEHSAVFIGLLGKVVRLHQLRSAIWQNQNVALSE